MTRDIRHRSKWILESEWILASIFRDAHVNNLARNLLTVSRASPGDSHNHPLPQQLAPGANVSAETPIAAMPPPIPPHTPQAPDVAGLPTHAAYQAAPAAPPAAAVKTTPTKSTLKALPTVRDHTTDQLTESGDEYVPREHDEFGEKKVLPNGQLQGGRVYRCRTFLVPNRGDKLFMLATECARVLGYRDSYLLFNKNRSLFKIIASQTEKDDLVQQEILPFSYRSRQIAIVTARSMFRQFGSRVIENGRRVRDDYWEQKARKQGFTEADLAGEKRPGAAKAREAAEAQNNIMAPGPHTEIVYNNNPAAYPGPPQPPLVQPGMMGPLPPGSTTRMPGLTSPPDLTDARTRDYSGIAKGGPRQEISGPPYQDQTRPSPIGEVHSQASQAADFNRSVNQQREMRNDYMQAAWRRPHEQPPTTLGSSDPIPTSRPVATSPHATAASGISQPPVISSHSPQMMMTGPPYSQGIQAQSTPGHQPPLRGRFTKWRDVTCSMLTKYRIERQPDTWVQLPAGPDVVAGTAAAAAWRVRQLHDAGAAGAAAAPVAVAGPAPAAAQLGRHAAERDAVCRHRRVDAVRRRRRRHVPGGADAAAVHAAAGGGGQRAVVESAPTAAAAVVVAAAAAVELQAGSGTATAVSVV